MNMNKKQKIAIVTPLILVVFMYPAFQLEAMAFVKCQGGRFF